MRRTFREADFSALTDLWNSFFPIEFAIDVDIFRLNTVESRFFDWGASAFDVNEDGTLNGFTLIKRSANPLLYGGSEIDTAHLSAIAFNDPKVGVDLFADAKRILRDRGVSVIKFGQDSRHFFPGCPAGCAALCSFLMVEGFEENGDAFDLQRDLASYQPPKAMTTDFECKPLGASDHDALDALLANEFSSRWRFDVMRKSMVDGPQCVTGLFVEGKLTGFALTQNQGTREPIGGAVWRVSLGENWGSMGPIGVAKEVRGNGLGHALLSGALTSLKDSGARKCIIDWTVRLDFYRRHGFEPTRQYHQLSLKLD